MKKYKVLMLIGILSFVILASLAFVNVSYLQVLLTNDKDNSPKLCSPVTNGLKFCTNSQKITVNSDDAVVLNFSLINASEQEILVKTNRDLTKYNLKVTDENGEISLTKLEKKIRNNAMSSDDQKDFINSLTTSHRSEILKPNQILNEKIVLSDIYDFTNPGKYYVEVARKTINPNGDGFIEISLEKIEIEVKQAVMPKSTP